MLYVILSNGEIYQGHYPNREAALEAASFMERSWAEWMGEILYPPQS